jgi:hypothetical protein
VSTRQIKERWREIGRTHVDSLNGASSATRVCRIERAHCEKKLTTMSFAPRLTSSAMTCRRAGRKPRVSRLSRGRRKKSFFFPPFGT